MSIYSSAKRQARSFACTSRIWRCPHRRAFSATPQQARRQSDISTIGVYHTLVLAPATSNTVAKCVYGISDNLATNVFVQAGKCRVPAIVFACDTAPELETEAPKSMVRVYPRRIDLENTCRLKSFDATEVVESLDELEQALARRKRGLATHG
jgi:dihydromethanopterin reductase (acceptor)